MPPLRRNQRPLFDLIGQIPSGASSSGGTSPPRSGGADSMIEPTLNSPVSKGKLTDRAPGDEMVPFDRYASPSRGGGSGVNVSINALYIAGAALVVVAVLVWVGGYVFGMRAKQKELEPALRSSVMPSGGEPSGGASVPPPTLGGAAPANDPSILNDVKPVVGPGGKSGSFLSIRGLIASDPRTPGLNYLHIERLPAADAERVIAFFAKNNIETIGVPVEQSGKAANNVPLYSVVAVKGITGEQYRQKDKARSGLESEVVRLGSVWQREYKGTSNFTRSNWMKYQP